MNSFELNKIMGAVLGTCLALLAINIAAGAVFTQHKPEKAGFDVAVKEEAPAAGAGGAQQQSAPIETLLAAASADKGKDAAKPCLACHTFEKGGPNKVGPNLYGIVNDEKGHGRGGFKFSQAMAGKGGKWTFADLNQFLLNPKGFVPGTAMGFAGIQRDNARADVIAYLNSLSDSPAPLPKAADAGAAKPADAKPADAGAAKPAEGKPADANAKPQQQQGQPANAGAAPNAPASGQQPKKQ